MRHFLSGFFLILLCAPAVGLAQDYSVYLTSGTFIPAETGPAVEPPASGEVFDGKFFRAIQFYAIPTEADKARLRAKGITLHRYLPNNLFTAILPAVNAQQALAGETNVRAVFKMSSLRKLSEGLQGGNYPAHATRPGGGIALVVTHQPGLSSGDVAAWLKGWGATVTEYLPQLEAHAITISTDRIVVIAREPFVAAVNVAEPDGVPENTGGRTSHRSNTLATSYAGGLKWDGAGVTVALNDDGVIGPHIDYTGRLAAQYTTVNNGNHGDHCAGTIFGAGNRTPTARGMAAGATLRVYRAVSGTTLGYQAFDSIYNHYPNLGVRITSTSYSDGTNAGYTTRARLMDQTIRQMPELMHVFSAGNAGTSSSSYGAGAGWANITGGQKMGKNVIAVGNLDSLDNLNSSSSRGPAHDGRVKPEVCAVGTNVQSTIQGNIYDNYTGTSMACPGVAGTLAQLYHGWKSTHGGANPRSALIKAAVMNTADDLGNAGPDYRYGYGRVNARRAWKLLSAAQFFHDSVTQGITKTHTITVPAGTQEVRVMLYWADYEATANAAVALVNNLDLTVATPSSTTVLPWKLNRSPNSTSLNQPAFQGVDSLNNVEQVTIPTPAAGTYTITVAGTAIPQGPQQYYVVYETRGSDVTLTYPIGGEALVPGVSETIRWDAYGNSGSFTLEYSTDSGSTWSTISTTVGSAARHYNWTPPSTVTGRGMIRVTRGSSSDASDAGFTVIGVPASLSVNWVCTDSMQVSYSSVAGAARYELTVLGSAYMDSVGTSTTTSCIGRGLNTGVQNWYSVQAVAPNGAKGRRATAQLAPVLPVNCPGAAAADLFVQSIITPGTAMSSCVGGSVSDSVRIVIKNGGATLFSNIAVGYSLDGGAAVTATVPGSILAQQTKAFTFPSPVVLTGTGSHTLKVWTQHNGDMVPGNDTATRSIVVTSVPSIPSWYSVENFETATICDTMANCGATSCPLPGNWTNEVNGGADSIDWRVWRGPTPTNASTGTTGPIMDFNPGIGSGKYIYLEADGCAGKTAHLVSPCFNVTPGGNGSSTNLSWGYHMRGAGTGELHLDVHVDGAWMLDVIPPFIGAQGTGWMTGSHSLAAYLLKPIRVRFRGITGPTAQSDIALDGITIATPESIAEVPGESFSVSVFPNPSAAGFGVSLAGLTSDATLTVTDAAGRVVESTKAAKRGGVATSTLSMRGAPAGVYFLTVRSEDGSVVRKLVKL